MAGKALLVALLLAVVAFVAWQTGLVGPTADPLAGPAADGVAPGDVAASGTPEAAALAGGRVGARPAVVERPTARTQGPDAGAPRVTGLVLDGTGAPVDGARVVSMPDTLARSLTVDDLGAADLAAFDAITDAKGRFVVGVAPDAPVHAIVAIASRGDLAYASGVRPGADVTLTVAAAGTIAGTVVDLEGTPVVGATVALTMLVDVLRVERTATTGAGGAYRIADVPAQRPSGGGDAAAWMPGVLTASAAGYAPLLVQLTPPEPGKTVERQLVLTRGSTLTGKVLDGETDAPVVGARVVAWSSEGGQLGGWRPSGTSIAPPWSPRLVGETVTDAAGAFRLERLPARGFHGIGTNDWGPSGPVLGQVAAIAPGGGPATSSIEVRDEGATQDVTLKVWGAATVTGRVVGEDGAPLAGVAVSATTKNQTKGVLPPSLFPEAGEPSAGGAKDAAGLRAGGTGADGAYRLANVPVSRTRDDEVKVVGRRILKGPQWGRMGSEDGDGTLTVKARGGATVVAPDLVLKASPSTANANTLVAKVRVLLPDGAPAWGASVGSLTGAMTAQERTDRDGWVTVAFFNNPRRPVQGPQMLRATLKGFAAADGPITPTADGTATVTIPLKPARRLTGRVLTSDRLPAAGVNVMVGDGSVPIAQVFPEVPARAGSLVAPPPPPFGERAARGRALLGSVRTDDEGRFAVDSLPDGPYHLVAQPQAAPGSTTPRARGTLLDVPTDATGLEIVLPVDPAPPTGVLVGTVRDAVTGRAPPKLTVALKRDDVGIGTAMSGQDGVGGGRGGRGDGAIAALGRFEFTDVPAGPVVVTVTSEGYTGRTVEVAVRAGETTTVPPVELARGITVRGRVRLPDGLPTEGTRRLGFTPLDDGEGQAWIQATLAADGTYEASGFLPGRWRVVSWPESSGSEERAMLVPAEGVLLALAEGSTLVTFDPTLLVGGTLIVNSVDARLPAPRWEGDAPATDEQKRFAAGCRVQVLDAAGVVLADQRGGFARGDAGKVGWLVLPPGAYKVRSELPGEPPKEETVEVPSRFQVSVRFGTPLPGGNTPGVR